MSSTYAQYARKASLRGKEVDLPLVHEEARAFASLPYERLTSSTFLHAAPQDYLTNGVFLVTWLLPWESLSELALGAFRLVEEPRVAAISDEGVLLEGEVYATCCVPSQEWPEEGECAFQEQEDAGEEVPHYCGTQIYDVLALLHEVETPAILHNSLPEGWEEEAIEMLQEEDDEALEDDYALTWAPKRLTNPANGREYRLILRDHED